MLIGKADFNLSGNFKTLSQLRDSGLEKNLNEHSNGDIRFIRSEVQNRPEKNSISYFAKDLIQTTEVVKFNLELK